MSFKPLHLFSIQRWRAASAFARAMGAYRRGHHDEALIFFERAMCLESARTPEHMAFLAILMSLNNRRADVFQIFTRIASGEFARDRPSSKYAEALARYWIAFLTGRPDVVARWLDAHALKPSEGFAARYLNLPDKPLLTP